MNNSHILILSLGSNMGNRMEYLQQAVDNIQKKIGDVTSVSKVYKTPSWGFSSWDFLNACIEVRTQKNPTQCIEEILKIEAVLGRIRDKKENYSPRVIDIDVIFYDKEEINDKHLVVPHPLMCKRRFVLQPLMDICPDFMHTKEKKTIAELLKLCKDNSKIEEVKEKLYLPAEK